MEPKEWGKKAAGEACVDELVKPGMKLGLGTGSTALWAIRRTSELYASGRLPGLLVVPTSLETLWECQAGGLAVRSLNDPDIAGVLDLYIDGADEIDPGLNVIKGGGAAHLQEKIVCSASREFVIIADSSKAVPDLGTRFPIPLEVHELARTTVSRAVEALGGKPVLRFGKGKQGPIITDNGHIVLDVTFPTPVDPAAMEVKLKLLTGVFEVGLFAGKASRAYLGYADGRVEILTPATSLSDLDFRSEKSKG